MKNCLHIWFTTSLLQPVFVALLCCMVIICPFSAARAQQDILKKLQHRLQNAKHDTDRVNTYYSFSRYYWGSNADSALFMAKKSLSLAQQIHFDKGIALAYLSCGVALQSKGELPAALDYYFKSLRISQQLELEGLSGNLYSNIGNVYLDMGDHHKEALDYYYMAYKIALKQNDPTGFTTFGPLVNIGEVFKYMGKPDSAIAYNALALAIAERVKDSVSIATAQFNIGENYITLKQYHLARVALYRALHIAEKAGDAADAMYCHNALALMYYYTGNQDSALFFGRKGLKESREAGFADLIQKGYHVLYLVNKQNGNYKEALYYHEKETTLADSLDNAEKVKAIKNIQALYDLEKQQQQLALLSKDNLLTQAALDRAVLRRNILLACAVVLLVAALLLLRSYTQKRKLNAKLKEQNENMAHQNKHLEKLVDTKDRMFSIIGHDLRGPVHAVNSMLALARTDQLPVEDMPFIIEKAGESLEATAQLLDNLLYWAKSQMEKMEPNPEKFDIQNTIRSIVSLLVHRAADKKIKVLQTPGIAPLPVYADRTMIEMVIRNLAENALKFSKAGDTVTIAAMPQNNNILVTIKDSGVGIPVEEQSKIFNKSAIYTTYGTKREKGSGLGLLLCRELVELNNGTIGFESAPGKGSNFYFTVPAEN